MSYKVMPAGLMTALRYFIILSLISVGLLFINMQWSWVSSSRPIVISDEKKMEFSSCATFLTVST